MKTFLSIIGGLVVFGVVAVFGLGWYAQTHPDFMRWIQNQAGNQVSSASSMDTGIKALKNKDYGTAVNEFLPLAKQGKRTAQFYLGTVYLFGSGEYQNYPEAAKWFRLAAEQGSSQAQLCLGIMYARGEGFDQDTTEAAKWYRLAADKGNAEAQYLLGLSFEYGHGVPQDYVQAYMWLSLASSNVKQDAISGNFDAMQERAKVSNEMTTDATTGAQELVEQWKRSH